jgi:hypothetical protein
MKYAKSPEMLDWALEESPALHSLNFKGIGFHRPTRVMESGRRHGKLADSAVD